MVRWDYSSSNSEIVCNMRGIPLDDYSIVVSDDKFVFLIKLLLTNRSIKIVLLIIYFIFRKTINCRFYINLFDVLRLINYQNVLYNFFAVKIFLMQSRNTNHYNTLLHIIVVKAISKTTNNTLKLQSKNFRWL